MTKCAGCGAESQKKLCEKCFRLKHYHELSLVNNINDCTDVFQKIPFDAHVLLVVDPLNIGTEFEIFKRFKNISLIIAKKDQFPTDIKDQKLLEFMDQFNFNFKNKLVVSSFNNYQIDELYQLLQKFKENYFVGFANSGKSTLINQLIYNYSDKEKQISTSIIPGTTVDMLKIIFPKTVIFDTPGVILENNMIYHLATEQIKNLATKKRIKPITYQIKEDQTIIIFDNLYFSFPKNNSVTFYLSNEIELNRIYQKLKDKKSLEINQESDIVIPGVGFINVKKAAIIYYDAPEKVAISIREPLI